MATPTQNYGDSLGRIAPPNGQLDLNLSTFWRFWPDRQIVALESERGTGDRLIVYVQAFRRNPTHREFAASGGAYLAQDLIFLIPAAFLPDDVTEIKPGDRVLDDETAWTVIEAQWNAQASHWRLQTRNASIAFDLRDTFTVWLPTNTKDDARSRVSTFAQSGGTHDGRFQLQREGSEESRGKTLWRLDYILYTADDISTLTHEVQIRDASSGIYEIDSVTNRMRLGELGQIFCHQHSDN